MTREISKEEYKNALFIVKAYETRKKELDKITGKSVCPFCSGSKVTPFIRNSRSQDCNECDKDGMITNRKLHQLDLLPLTKNQNIVCD